MKDSPYKFITSLQTVRLGSWAYSRSAVGGRFPAPKSYQTLMALLEGKEVFTHVYSPTNVVGFTNEEQLRDAYSSLNADKKFYIKVSDLREVIALHGDGKMGFHMGGMYCEATPAELEKSLFSS